MYKGLRGMNKGEGSDAWLIAWDSMSVCCFPLPRCGFSLSREYSFVSTGTFRLYKMMSKSMLDPHRITCVYLNSSEGSSVTKQGYNTTILEPFSYKVSQLADIQ